MCSHLCSAWSFRNSQQKDIVLSFTVPQNLDMRDSITALLTSEFRDKLSSNIEASAIWFDVEVEVESVTLPFVAL